MYEGTLERVAKTTKSGKLDSETVKGQCFHLPVLYRPFYFFHERLRTTTAVRSIMKHPRKKDTDPLVIDFETITGSGYRLIVHDMREKF